jgi:hypothetical protein
MSFAHKDDATAARVAASAVDEVMEFWRALKEEMTCAQPMVSSRRGSDIIGKPTGRFRTSGAAASVT